MYPVVVLGIPKHTLVLNPADLMHTSDSHVAYNNLGPRIAELYSVKTSRPKLSSTKLT